MKKTLHKVEAIHCISAPKTTAVLCMLGYQKGKMAEKPQKNNEKWQGIVLGRLAQQRKHYLVLARKSFKNQKNT